MFNRIRSVAGGVVFLVLCAGGAFAMPAALSATGEEETTSTLDAVLEDLDTELTQVAVEGETTDVTVPDEDEEDEEEADDSEGDSEGKVNHGKAVSTAAHCAVKGRAHGELVRSIAQDKAATVESAQAACDAALAAQAAAPTKMKPAKPAKPAHAAKPDKVAKPVKAPKAPVVEETTEVAPAETGGPPAHAGPPPGKGKKP